LCSGSWLESTSASGIEVTRPSTGKKKINIFFDEKMFEALRRIGEARGVTYSELIREACRQYVFKEGGKVVQEAVEYRKLVPR
jgi:metal-responsive CopG/Arc/MetJ family transcriptional regulator